MVTTEPAVRQTARDMTPTSWSVNRAIGGNVSRAVITVHHKDGPSIAVWCETEKDIAALTDELRGEAFRAQER